MNLSALNKATAQTAPRTSGISPFMEIELHMIDANPNQPRKYFNPSAIFELSESIKTHGLIQPISVVRRGTRYMIVSGERRFEAHKVLGSLTIRAHILDVDDHAVQEMALIENIQREDLTDFEKAKFIGELWGSGKYATKTDLANAIGKSQSYISKAFGCLRLDPDIIRDLEDGKRDIGITVLEELSRIDRSLQKSVYDKYNAGEITRDQFKEVGKSDPKVSQGKKEPIKIAKLDGSSLMMVGWLGLKGKLEPKKYYKITIEEIT